MSRKFKGPVGDCTMQHGLECPIRGRQCGKCGWNPEVKEKRLKKIRKLEWFRAYVKRCGVEVK